MKQLTKRFFAILLSLAMVLQLCPFTPVTRAKAETGNYVLKVLTFEDGDYKGDSGDGYWSSLIDEPQYGGTQLYGDDGMGMDEPYWWWDDGNTNLYHALPLGYGNYCYWSYGEAISHYVGSDLNEYGTYNYQLTVYKAGVDGIQTSGGGHNGSDNFAVHYGYADTSGYGLDESHLPELSFLSHDGKKESHVIEGMWINLTPYLLQCIVNGNNLTSAMGKDDSLYVKAYGYDADGKLLNTTQMTVCDGTELKVRDWTYWDLTALGEVASVKLEINGSSDNGYGFSQPAYFAYDDVTVRFPVEENVPAEEVTELTASSTTSMFNAVSGAIVKDTATGQTYLRVALNGTGYEVLMADSYDEAVASTATTPADESKWIHYTKNDAGKYEFMIPIEEGQTLVAVQSLSASKYKQGNPVWYSRQFVIDYDALTVVSGDYDQTRSIEVTDSAELGIASAAIETIGGPKSNNYEIKLIAALNGDAYTKAYIGTAEEAAAAAATVDKAADGTFGLSFLKNKTGGTVDFTYLDTATFVSFYDATAAKWDEYKFTLSNTNGTLIVEKEKQTQFNDQAPVLVEGAKDVEDTVVVGTAYLLRKLQSGQIFVDPQGDTLNFEGNYFYQKSTDGGETWSEELTFAASLFGATTISLVEKTVGTYQYRFYAKDNDGNSSVDNGVYWNLTLHVVEASEATFDTSFFVSRDQNYASNGNVYPIIKVYPSDGKGNIAGKEVTFTDSLFGKDAEGEETAVESNTIVDNYNMFYASLKGGWYVYRAYGWNASTEAYDVELGGMQIKIPMDGNVDGSASGGTNIYLRVSTIHTTTKKTDSSYFGESDYSVRWNCPIMECDATIGKAYVNGSYTYYPTMLYAGGNACLYNRYVIPTDTENYTFNQGINATVATGYTIYTSQALSINAAQQLTVTVPKSADYALYLQWNNFNTTEVEPLSEVDNDDDTKTLTFTVSKGNANYTWRMTDTTGQYVTKAGWLPSVTASTAYTYSFDGGETNKNSHDFSKLGSTTATRDEADLQVFLSSTGAKTLTGKTRVRAYRMWQLINSDTANIMIEPDYTWDILSGDASITYAEDVQNTDIHGGNSYHNWADITANGTSVIAVNYDSIQTYLDGAASTYGSHAGFYPATDPARTGVIIVTDQELGAAKANVQFNGQFDGNSRDADWDYIYDTWYYMNTDTNPALTFGATDAASVEYATVITDGASMESTLSKYTAITADANGRYTVPLAAFNNAANNYGGTVIIRCTDTNGAYSYQLVHVARMTVNVANDVRPGDAFTPGDTATITFDGLYRSINKISGIFNPTTFYLRYTSNGSEVNGTLGQYQQMDRSSLSITIPKDLEFPEGQSETTYTITNGYVYGSMYSAANPFGAMYYMTDTGVGTNFNAVTCSFAFQKMADITIPVIKAGAQVNISVLDEEGKVLDESKYTITVSDSDGSVMTLTDGGFYAGSYGTYTYKVVADGFIMEKGSFVVGSADAEAGKSVAISLRAADETVWDGTTKTEPEKDADGTYLISSGAELAWFANEVNVNKKGAINAKLMNNISLGWYAWTPIGNSTTKYSGTFDGNGHFVTDVDISSKTTNTGFFGNVLSGTIKNLGIDGNVTSTSTNTGGIAGFVAGATGKNAVIENCVNKAKVAGTGYTAGIVGRVSNVYVEIRNCYNTGAISGSTYTAGIAASAMTIRYIAENVYSSGTVKGTTVTYVGPVVTLNSAGAANLKNAYYLEGVYTGNCTNTLHGTAKTSQELMDLAPVLGDAYAADTTGINDGYPILTWQVPEVPVERKTHSITVNVLNSEGQPSGMYEMENAIVTELEDGTYLVRMHQKSVNRNYMALVPDTSDDSKALATKHFVDWYIGDGADGYWYVIPVASLDDTLYASFSMTKNVNAGKSWSNVQTITFDKDSMADTEEADVTSEELNVSPALECHVMKATAQVDATCTTAGTEAYWTCDKCGKLFSDAEGQTEIEAPVVIAAKGHTEESLEAVAASCTETGLTAGRKCSVCGEILVAQEVVPALGHDYGEWTVVTEPSYEADGLKTRSCSRCEESEEVVLPMLQPVTILTQPENYVGKIGDTASFTVVAAGEGLNYQWYYSKDGEKWSKSGVDSAQTATLSIRLIESRNGQMYKCTITDAGQNTVTTDVVTMSIKPASAAIVEQPVDQWGKVGDTVTFTVGTEDENLTYQWQFANDGAGWANSGLTGAQTNTLTVPVTNARFNQRFKCIVTAADGTKIESEVVRVKKIVTAKVDVTAQADGAFLAAPETLTVPSDKAEAYGYTDSVDGVSALDVLVAEHEVIFGEAYTAEAAADYLKVSTTNFITTIFGVVTSNCGFTINDQVPVEGELISSDWGNYYMGLTISTAKVVNGDSVNFFLYQDDYSLDNYTFFKDTAGYSRSFETEVGTALNLQVMGYCVAYYGFNYNNLAAVQASCQALEDLQLAIVNAETGSMVDIDDAITDEDGKVALTFDEEGTYLITAYVTAEDIEENYATPAVMTLATVKVVDSSKVLAITAQPESVVNGVLNTVYNFSITATGEGLTYQWYYSKDGGNVWSRSGMTGALTDTLSVKLTSSRNGQMYRCVVKDANGNTVTSDTVVISK